MRRYFVFFISLIAFTGSLTTVFVTQDIKAYELRGYVDPTRTTDLPYRIPRLGVNADLFQYSEDELRQQLALMDEAHIRWARQFIYWDEFEPVQGQYAWDVLDSVMVELEAYPHIQLVPVFMNSPQWARESDVVTAPPSDPSMITPFVSAFADRYGQVVDYYQIWDEPNLDDAWGLQDPRPAEYVALLSEAHQAIHGNDTDAHIIAAALAPTTEIRGQNIADVRYLQMMYDLGASDYFEAAAGKPYGFDNVPLDRTTNIETLNFSRLVLLREVMVANGDGQSALWASNWGWNSLPDDWDGDASIWGQVNEATRVNHTVNALHRANREWAWLGGMVLHHWQPDVARTDAQWGFAIIDQDNTPTALWDALTVYGEQDIARNGLYHPRTEYAQYSGLWTFSELGADIGWLETSDSQLAFDFYGRDVALLAREGDYFAFLYPTVDGSMPSVLPNDVDGNAYLLLRSDDLEPQLSMSAVARGLSLEAHVLEVIADRGWDQWALAGYAVSDGNLAEPFDHQLIVAWFATITSALALGIAGYLLPRQGLYSQLRHITSALSDFTQVVISVLTSIALMLGMLLSFGMSDPTLFRRELADPIILIIITGGLIAVELPLVVIIISLLVLFWFIYHRIELGLLLTLLYAPFFLFPVELYQFAFPMSELLILVTTGAWLLRLFVVWGHERQSANSDYAMYLPIRWTHYDSLMVVWGVLGVLAVVWSARTSPALTELRIFFIEPLLFYMMLRTVNLTWSQMKRLFDSLLIASVIIAVYGIVLYMLGQGIIEAEGGARRLTSVYGSPNNVGLFLGRVIPYALAIVLLVQDKMRWVALSALGVMLVTVAMTQSVGTLLIGVPIGVMTVILCIYGRRALPIIGVLIVVGIIATLGLTQVSTRFASLLDLSTGTNFIRLRVWDSALELISQHPIKGIGLDQFLYEFRGAYVRPDAIADPDLSHPHNIVLDFWLRLGLMGVVWLGVFSWKFVQDGYLHLKAVGSINQHIVLIGVMGMMAATMAHGLIDNSIYVNDLVYVFVFGVGVMAKLSTDSD